MSSTFAISNYEFCSVRSNNLSLKYKRLTTSGCKDIGILNLSFWQRHFLYVILSLHLYSLMFLATMHDGSIENFQFASILSFTFTDQLDIKIYLWYNIFQSSPAYNLAWSQHFSLGNLRTNPNKLIPFWYTWKDNLIIDGSSIYYQSAHIGY